MADFYCRGSTILGNLHVYILIWKAFVDGFQMEFQNLDMATPQATALFNVKRMIRHRLFGTWPTWPLPYSNHIPKNGPVTTQKIRARSVIVVLGKNLESGRV